MDAIRKMDMYPKLKAEDQIRTTHGACLSFVALIVMSYLFVSEFMFYRNIDVKDRLIVNSTHGEHLKVSFDINFPHIPCDLLSLDAMDTSGQKQEGLTHRIYKQKLNSEGDVDKEFKNDKGVKVKNLGTLQHEQEMIDAGEKAIKSVHVECGNCYGAEATPGQCCDTCQDVKNAYTAKGWGFSPEGIVQCAGEQVERGFKAVGSEGCNVAGSVDLTTVNGNFHVAPGASTAHSPFSIQQLLQETFQSFNITHEIKSLSFGNHFPGIMNPLDGHKKIITDGHGMFQYYIKVVPTVYQYLDGRRVESNQYSVTEHLRHINPGSGRGLPGVWFFYEVSPVHALFEETRHSTLEFIASVCAILGGIFTILGTVDRALGMLFAKLDKKGELGR